MKEIILYALLAMIFYDFSIHFIYLIHKEGFIFKHGLRYWPNFKNPDGTTKREKYQGFWTTYWGIAFVLLLLYVIS